MYKDQITINQITFKMWFLCSVALFLSLSAQSTEARPGQRIIGGEVARTRQFPFAAAIDVRSSAAIHFCSGTLIGNEWVLTSASCIDGAQQFTIKLGSNHLTSADANRQTVSSNEHFVAPNYNAVTLQNNVGLIKLRLPVTFNDNVQPVSLPGHEIPDTLTGTAIGWGQLSDFDTGYPDDLHFVNLAIVPLSACQVVFGNVISNNALCASGNFNEGICVGDMGGPLLVNLAGDRGLWQVGVASFLSQNGCESVDPSGYTRTYPYVDWIRSVTGLEIS